MTHRATHVLIAAVALTLISGCAHRGGWESTLARELPRYGHRNFIVIADSAYPLQSAPGITTVYTGVDQLEAVRKVIDAVEQAAHVNPVIYVDQELASVAEADAPGVSAYRDALSSLLQGRGVKRLPHMEIIEKLDESAKLFNVLLFKTDLTLPYTSVFVELDCGYWDGEKEARLRKALGTE